MGRKIAVAQNSCDDGLLHIGGYGFLPFEQGSQPVATMMRDMKGRTAEAVAVTRAPIGLEAPVFLITLVLLGLLTQAAWMHAT